MYDLILCMYDMIPSDTKRMNMTILYDFDYPSVGLSKTI